MTGNALKRAYSPAPVEDKEGSAEPNPLVGEKAPDSAGATLAERLAAIVAEAIETRGPTSNAILDGKPADHGAVAKFCYGLADAMLAERRQVSDNNQGETNAASDVRVTRDGDVGVTTLHCPCGVVHVLSELMVLREERGER